MRSLVVVTLVLLSVAGTAEGATAKLKKILPHYIDLEGQHTLSPSLFERDAYQAELRRKPELRGGLRFDIHWTGPRKLPVVLRVELRGTRAGNQTTADLQQEVVRRGWFSKWSSLQLSGEAYEIFGELVAWRATIWSGDKLLAEQRSFLW